MKSLLTIAACILLFACKTSQTAMIVGDNYDEKKNETTLTLLPYGSIVLPGKWTKFDYHRDSRQHYFRNTDSTIISVAKNPKDKYPVYKQGMTDKDFATAFVNWDTAYWKQKGIAVNILKHNEPNNYIVWQTQDSTSRFVNTIFVYGAKNDYVYNFSGSSKAWDANKLQEFLVQVYSRN